MCLSYVLLIWCSRGSGHGQRVWLLRYTERPLNTGLCSLLNEDFLLRINSSFYARSTNLKKKWWGTDAKHWFEVMWGHMSQRCALGQHVGFFRRGNTRIQFTLNVSFSWNSPCCFTHLSLCKVLHLTTHFLLKRSSIEMPLYFPFFHMFGSSMFLFVATLDLPLHDHFWGRKDVLYPPWTSIFNVSCYSTCIMYDMF